MTPSRPYLIRAIYEWLVDNQLTPYIMVDAEFPKVIVPQRFIEDGKIILNIAPQAIAQLVMNNDVLEFDASFSAAPFHVYAPMKSIMAIYAFENGRGMVFQGEEDEEGDDEGGGEPPQIPPGGKGKPSLKIVK